MAVNIETITPKANVIANPLTILDVNIIKIKQVIKVEILLSRMEVHARLNPSSIDLDKDLQFSNSFFILEKIKILASTAIPIEIIKPAIPDKVKVTGQSLKIAKTRIL